jgi:ABC-type Fe3+/spermidine/putrescine transport system ATPase subunit
MIEIRSVSCRYPEFDLDVDFSVEKKEIVTLLGSSGSGKTTTLRIIAGFERPDAGRILVENEDVTDTPPQRRRIGFVFQDFTLLPHLTVGQNIAYGLRAQRVDRKTRDTRVEELLNLIGLDGFRDRAVQTLSGGEQQRVAVARALAPQPRALLLDEPFSAIDTERREDLRRHLVHIQRTLGIPMIFVTHSRTEAMSIADRIIILHQGRIMEEGTPRDLYARPSTMYAARFLGKANILPAGIAYRYLVNGSHEGSNGYVMIRPENVRLGAGLLEGTVTTAHYHGMFWEYDLTTPVGEIHVTDEESFPTGTRLRLGFPEDALVSVRE